MSESSKVKANLRSGDYNRAMLTDTAPFEVPLIFSNDGLYKNLGCIRKCDSHYSRVVEAILRPDKYTIPYRYNIVKNSRSSRQLSLLHPSIQFEVCRLYELYEELICYYSSQSSFSIRAPRRVGSSFYFPSPIADRNKYRNSYIDTIDIDKLTRNPASYFAYRGYNRLYKFFGSPDFLSLEKKFSRMTSLDISKCFDSIYTHSIAWALKDIDTAKQSINASHFGSYFDSLMQRMNYNETNGICIGAETSRIFAELILGRVDQNIENILSGSGFKLSRDYEIRRYVDNYYIFSASERVSDRIQACIAACLREFKLHLNESKIESIERPFYTKKSKITDDVSKSLEGFFLKVIGTDVSEGKIYSYPLKILRYDALLQHIIREVKSNCHNSSVGYEEISNYIISALSIRLGQIIEDYTVGSKKFEATEDDYVTLTLLLLELIFFFYSMSPTVASSLPTSKSIVISARSFKSNFPHRLPLLQERIVRWTSQLMRDPRLAEISRDRESVPVEILNILIAMHDIAADHTFSEETFRHIFSGIGKAGYFSIISCLFIIRDNPKFNILRGEVLERVKEIIESSPGLSISAHDAHLALDILSCPFLPVPDRVSLYKSVVKTLKVAACTNAEAENAINECEHLPWFVSWRGVELLNLITKKELSSVY